LFARTRLCGGDGSGARKRHEAGGPPPGFTRSFVGWPLR
jgi:hypothetical protein